MTDIKRLDSRAAGFREALEQVLTREAEADRRVETAVQEIIAAVRDRGDDAVLEFTGRFDNWTPGTAAALEVPFSRCERALAAIDAPLRDALERSAERIRSYAKHQKLESWSYTEEDGTLLGQQVTAMDRVGLYVPGGKAAYPSSVLMNAIPASIAGVSELIMVAPTPAGEVNDIVLAAAAVAGVDRVFAIGGAQAVAALAWGTATIPAVDKIVGPGNAYVAAAKRMVFGKVGIDMIAGPSEVLVIADDTGNADWIAADLLAQAEHDVSAQSILITDSPRLAADVERAVEAQLATLPRAVIARASWDDFGAVIMVSKLDDAIELANAIAAEHLEIMTADAEGLSKKVRNAGAIFLGPHTPEAIGDYVGGSNHVLPTARSARFSSGLGVLDFMKRTSILRCGPDQLRALGPAAMTLGQAEGLDAHSRSVGLRLNLS